MRGNLNFVMYRSHLSINGKEKATQNLSLAGRTLDQIEENCLDYLLQHPCGWSATSTSHRKDSCFKYIQHQFFQDVALRPGKTLQEVYDGIQSRHFQGKENNWEQYLIPEWNTHDHNFSLI
jgi:hypothetical protein